LPQECWEEEHANAAVAPYDSLSLWRPSQRAPEAARDPMAERWETPAWRETGWGLVRPIAWRMRCGACCRSREPRTTGDGCCIAGPSPQAQKKR